jgi:hypothetical protein
MKADTLIRELKRKFNLSTDRALAAKLGMTEIALGNWKRKIRPLTPRQIANAIEKSASVAVLKSQRSLIRPVVEFFPLDAVESTGGVRYELFPAKAGDSLQQVQLREALHGARGIYVFYDSRGRAIYAGKAKQQSLWQEMKNVFNRDRKTQTVYRVKHPTRAQAFRPAFEKSRQPRETRLRLSDLAAYVSAFEVDVAVINDLEALLVRGFANDLLNVRMERFAGHAGRRATKTRKR